MDIVASPKSDSDLYSLSTEQIFHRILAVTGATICLYLVQYLSLYTAGRHYKKKFRYWEPYWDKAEHLEVSSAQVTDHYSFFHFLTGIGAYYFLSTLKSSTLEQKFLIALSGHVMFEAMENNPYFVDQYGKTFDRKYAGDSVVNSLADTVWFSYGFWLPAKVPWQVVLGVLAVQELWRGINLHENSFSIMWKIKRQLIDGEDFEKKDKYGDKYVVHMKRNGSRH